LLLECICGIFVAPLEHPQLTDGFLAKDTGSKFRVFGEDGIRIGEASQTPEGLDLSAYPPVGFCKLGIC
jgi:hypothetical protein